MTERRAWVERITSETAVSVTLTMKPGGSSQATGVAFFDRMLGAVARLGNFGLEVEARGDSQSDPHRTVEDVALAVGQALDQLLGDRSGLVRVGHAYAPVDEALARAVIDLSGRPFCRVSLPDHLLTAWVTPQFPMTLVGEFWRSLATRGKLTLHLDLERGIDPHHCAEALFRAAALALRETLEPFATDAPSGRGSRPA